MDPHELGITLPFLTFVNVGIFNSRYGTIDNCDDGSLLPLDRIEVADAVSDDDDEL
jgi:hypothetical protein